ncbi:hypothetical protein [Salinimicrobium soli]|uniref:hypothetical protein n=1 Tax=Salinimicrobium soli TaxID=1254399 RepID=UPI003AADC690
MKNIYFYYLAFIFPGVALALFWKEVPPNLALAGLILYVFVYRSFIDGWRLSTKGVIEKKDIWKLVIPGMRGKYFKELYTNK